MMTVMKIRPGLRGNTDPGWYNSANVPRARKVADAPVPAASPAHTAVPAVPQATTPHHHDH